jgi:hypothetical protein
MLDGVYEKKLFRELRYADFPKQLNNPVFMLDGVCNPVRNVFYAGRGSSLRDPRPRFILVLNFSFKTLRTGLQTPSSTESFPSPTPINLTTGIYTCQVCLKKSPMKKIYTSPDRLMVFHLKNILESYNIDCIIKNDFLAGAAGELPPHECWPEIWLKDDKKYEKALQILEKNYFADDVTPPSWTCTQCGEKLEGQFTACWQCGESRYRL